MIFMFILSFFLYKIIFSLKKGKQKNTKFLLMLEDDMSMGHDSPNLLALNYY